ncbi:MAG TPA: hypothetical protein VM146_07935 [Steroidobacteraceae bacterium]|nr:hypothetical protein [Steroidobacteraceae bacterium]
MGQTSDQIVSEIDRTRDELRSNFQELEARAKDAADWRNQFRRHPAPMMVAAMVGGMLLSMMLGRR